MEALPDLDSLSDQELRDLKDVGEGKSPLHDIDVDKLAEILATKASPPAE